MSQSLSPSLGLSIKEVAEITPYYQKVRVKNSANYYTQYRELNWAFGILLNKDFFLGYGAGIYMDAGLMFSGGDYRGTDIYPDNNISPVIAAGFFKDLGRAVHLRMGCKYNPAFPGSPVSAAINLDFNFLRRVSR